MAQITRLGLYGGPRAPYAGFIAREAAQEVVTAPVGGWDKLSQFDGHLERKRREEEEQERRKAEIDAIQSKLDRDIARIFARQQKQEQREKQLADLEQLIAINFNNADLPKVREFSQTVERAFVRAQQQGNISAVEAFEREFEQAREEEDFLLLAMIMLQ